MNLFIHLFKLKLKQNSNQNMNQSKFNHLPNITTNKILQPLNKFPQSF